MLELLERIPFPQQLDRIVIFAGLVAGALITPVVVVLLALLIFDEITAAELVFWLAAAVIILGALGAVLLPHIVHATLSLVVALLGVAGIFLLLGSEFLALVQVLIYGGGVTVLLLFGLMLTNASEDPKVSDGAQKPFAFLVGILLAAVIAVALVDQRWENTEPVVAPFSTLGERLFRDFGAPFEIASLVLIVALIGAVAVARRDRDEDDDAVEEGESS